MAANFEEFLNSLSRELTSAARQSAFSTSSEFERAVRQHINSAGGFEGVHVDEDPHPHAFPDISIPPFGIEVKFTVNDTWRSVANSVFESTRDRQVSDVYVLFGKMGGSPEVQWDRYEECVMHVRTSHVPRFELEIGCANSIFKKFGCSYAEFQKLGIHERMDLVRAYARGRLKKGERLWWLDDPNESNHSLPIQVRLYMSLDQEEKRRLRAESALLSPNIVKPSRSKQKYDDVVLYLASYHGVIASQARDLFSAGSVALRANAERGGNYLQRSLEDLQPEMRAAARILPDELFVEYWGRSVPPGERLTEWLKRADRLAQNWKPSDTLFIAEQAKLEGNR